MNTRPMNSRLYGYSMHVDRSRKRRKKLERSVILPLRLLLLLLSSPPLSQIVCEHLCSWILESSFFPLIAPLSYFGLVLIVPTRSYLWKFAYREWTKAYDWVPSEAHTHILVNLERSLRRLLGLVKLIMAASMQIRELYTQNDDTHLPFDPQTIREGVLDRPWLPLIKKKEKKKWRRRVFTACFSR